MQVTKAPLVTWLEGFEVWSQPDNLGLIPHWSKLWSWFKKISSLVKLGFGDFLVWRRFLDENPWGPTEPSFSVLCKLSMFVNAA
jgi:hypothetical protein